MVVLYGHLIPTRMIKYLDVCINNCLRCIWTLPRNCHTNILHSVSCCYSVFNICYKHFCSLFRCASNSSNLIVNTVFNSACMSCRNFIGFNCKFGRYYVCDYNDVNFDGVNIIGDKSLCVSGFDLCDLNVIVHSLCT